MGIQLFGRAIAVDVAGISIASAATKTGISETLRVKFKVVRSLPKEPNEAVIEIYNLTKDNRAALQESGSPLVLQAGYTENLSQIFGGAIDHTTNILNGRDWISSIQASDGGKEFRSARINTSIAGPAQIGDVLQAAADALGIDPGNIADKVSAGSVRGSLTEFVNGVVLSGKAEQQIEKIVKSMGYGWSIQDGKFQLLGPDETLGDQAFLLTTSTGLVGIPEAGEDGLVKARGLLQPEILPGKKIELQSETLDSINGLYRVEKATFSGDTWGSDWYVDIEGKPVT